MIIGFMGKAGAGKTTAALATQQFIIGSVIKSFATPLKEAVQNLFLFSDEQVYGTFEQKTAVDPRWGVSPREVMQRIGTDCIREMLCRDFHVKRMEAEINTSDATVIIDDVRFVDEGQMILNRGGILIAICRPPEIADDHASEKPPYALATHEIHNTGSLDDFRAKVCTYLYDELRRRSA